MQHDASKSGLKIAFQTLLVILIAVGIIFRFNWVNWSQGTNLHPDEYGLTNTLVQIQIPNSLNKYFNTRISPLSPYQKYDVAGQPTEGGADNRLRWGQLPITIIRFAGELTGNTGYDEIRLLGRSLSALADTLSLALLFLIGRRVYGEKIGLLATALSALSVMQIQQSHFMTVDNFGVLFTMCTMYCCVRIAQQPCLKRAIVRHDYKPTSNGILWFVLFGIAFGMAMASRINLLPLAGMLLVATFISIVDLKLKKPGELGRIMFMSFLLLVLAGVVSLLTFRITQPMSFRAEAGDTMFFTIHLNPDWVESMKVAQNESNGIGGGPPSEQWANRPAIIFPWVNMVVWGMGIPLGLTAWAGFLWAGWRSFKWHRDWRIHLLFLVWVGGYFLFMGTRFVKSVRYFLPVYPFLSLFAAWLILNLWTLNSEHMLRATKYRRIIRKGVVSLLTGIVIAGTFTWALLFINAIYRHDHTRIQAAHWIYQNIPAPIQITLDTGKYRLNIPISAPDGILIDGEASFIQPFEPSTDGSLVLISVARPISLNNGYADLGVSIASDPFGQKKLGEVHIPINADSQEGLGTLKANLPQIPVIKGESYYLLVSTPRGNPVSLQKTIIANENWDEGLPMPLDGLNPFGGLYSGRTMEVRWYDDEKKLQMFVDNLTQVDYIILPSQRAIWSVCRIPLTYPMTMEYYRALFDGRLGFDLVAKFNSDFVIGPLHISDVGGTVAWEKTADLPLFNYNFLAAEEAFSVYDHPPVWIFKKRADFDINKVKQILESIDLTKVIIQSPREATPIYQQ